jgi:sugar lactone lactonase YvrE
MKRLGVLMVGAPWRVALRVGLLLLASVPAAGAGERLVFERFVGAQLTPTGVDPNRDYFFAAGMAVDSRGIAYVADPVNDQVLIYNGSTKTRLVSVCCLVGPGINVPVFLKFPMSVAVDPRNDDVWITNTLTGHVIKMDKNQQLLNVFGGRGTGPGQFQSPIRVAVDGAGNLYVLDDGGRTCNVLSCPLSDANVRIQKFRSDGTFVRTWGSLCQFSFDPATGILSVGVSCNATAPGAAVIGDGQFGFDMQLGVLTSPHPPQQGFEVSLIGMAVDSLGNVYVADQNRVQKFNTNGALTVKWAASGSAGVAVDFADNLYVADFDHNRVQKFDGAGTFLTTVGSAGLGLGVFRSPAFVATPPKNLVAFCQLFLKPFDPTIQCQKIYVADVVNIRVQLLQARQDRDDDRLVDEVDVDPTLVSDEARLGDTGAQVLTRGGAPFVVYDAPGASSPDTIRVTTETTGLPAPSNVAVFCRNPNRPFGVVTIAADNAFDVHCSTPTLDVLRGPIGWTFTAPDGTVATATLNGGDSLSVDPATSTIRSNAGTLALVVGGTSVALAPAQSVFADTTPPTTVAVPAPGPNPNGWNNSDVSVMLTATDSIGGSGVKEINFSLSGAQAGASTISGNVATMPISANGLTTLTYFARDNAGNVAAAKTLTVRIDKTPPTASFGSPTPPANRAGWNNTDVAIPFTPADSLSGVASTNIASPLILTSEGLAVSGTVIVTDMAGNTSTVASPAVRIDKTPPTVACVRVRRQKHEDHEGRGRLLFQVTASDLLSQVSTITLGTVQLTDGEIIQIRPSKRPGVHLVSKTDHDDRDDPRIRRFQVGPGAALIKATDHASNVGTAVCPLPLQHNDDDEGKAADRGKGRERDRSRS